MPNIYFSPLLICCYSQKLIVEKSLFNKKSTYHKPVTREVSGLE